MTAQSTPKNYSTDVNTTNRLSSRNCTKKHEILSEFSCVRNRAMCETALIHSTDGFFNQNVGLYHQETVFLDYINMQYSDPRLLKEVGDLFPYLKGNSALIASISFCSI